MPLVRITFKDEEVMEGLIQNHSEFVLKTGFFFFPSDPEGNNWLVYVLKSQVKEFDVLGLRAAPRNLPDLSLHPPVEMWAPGQSFAFSGGQVWFT